MALRHVLSQLVERETAGQAEAEEEGRQSRPKQAHSLMIWNRSRDRDAHAHIKSEHAERCGGRSASRARAGAIAPITRRQLETPPWTTYELDYPPHIIGIAGFMRASHEHPCRGGPTSLAAPRSRSCTSRGGTHRHTWRLHWVCSSQRTLDGAAAWLPLACLAEANAGEGGWESASLPPPLPPSSRMQDGPLGAVTAAVTAAAPSSTRQPQQQQLSPPLDGSIRDPAAAIFSRGAAAHAAAHAGSAPGSVGVQAEPQDAEAYAAKEEALQGEGWPEGDIGRRRGMRDESEELLQHALIDVLAEALQLLLQVLPDPLTAASSSSSSQKVHSGGSGTAAGAATRLGAVGTRKLAASILPKVSPRDDASKGTCTLGDVRPGLILRACAEHPRLSYSQLWYYLNSDCREQIAHAASLSEGSIEIFIPMQAADSMRTAHPDVLVHPKVVTASSN